MVIDFSKNEGLLTEDYLSAVGYWSKWLLGRMFGDKTQMVGNVYCQAFCYSLLSKWNEIMSGLRRIIRDPVHFVIHFGSPPADLAAGALCRLISPGPAEPS